MQCDLTAFEKSIIHLVLRDVMLQNWLFPAPHRSRCCEMGLHIDRRSLRLHGRYLKADLSWPHLWTRSFSLGQVCSLSLRQVAAK
jgi:hypothetical protein